MLFNCHPIRTSAAVYAAKRCCALQSAVAFWIVFSSFISGCRQSNDSLKYQVGSSSMAPTWFGPHLTATCVHCGQHSTIVYEAYDPVVPTRCFSCGAVCICDNDLRSGEVIEILRPKASASLRRFDVVTFDTPNDGEAQSLQRLKRIWALPGERIVLREGKAWIDGRLLQKSAKALAAVCVPMSRFPKDTRSHWWVAESSNSDPIRIEAAANQSHLKLEPNQRIEFRYVRPNRNPEMPEMLPSPIVDDFPFNQNSIAQIHEVPNFLLAIELENPGLTPWFVYLRSEGQHYRVGVGSSAHVKSTSAVVDGLKRLLIAVCDGRLLVSTENHDSEWKLIDLKEILDPDNVGRDSLIAITTTETLRIKRLLVARDQWLGPRESRLTEWVPTGTEAENAGGYFLLGDNLQLSHDSRDTTVDRIAPNRITGRVQRLEDSPDWILSLLDHAFREVDEH